MEFEEHTSATPDLSTVFTTGMRRLSAKVLETTPTNGPRSSFKFPPMYADFHLSNPNI